MIFFIAFSLWLSLWLSLLPFAWLFMAAARVMAEDEDPRKSPRPPFGKGGDTFKPGE